jgi:hypothetical protein
MFLAERQFYITDPGCDVKMYVYKISWEFQMEIEQRCVVSCFHHKRIKPPAIVAELKAIDHEDAFDEKRMKYWLHERTKDVDCQPIRRVENNTQKQESEFGV